MAIAWVQSAGVGTNVGGSTNTTATGAFASSNTAHNAIIVGCAVDNTSATTSVTDTAGNIYTLQAQSPTSGNRFVEIWACFDIKSQASNVVTYTQGFNDGNVFAQEFSGLATTSALDQTGSNTGSFSVAPTVSTTGATTTADELVVAVLEVDLFGGDTIDTAGTGYSNFQKGASSFILGAMESKIVAATGTQTATVNVTNSSDSWRMAIATFKIAGGAAFVPAPNRLPRQAINRAGNY